MHISANRSLRDLAANKLELFGNVYIRRPAELLTADYAVLDMNTETLVAEGNVIYFTPDSVTYGSKMNFNFLTRTGTIENGRVESSRYQLIGEKLERLGVDEYVAEDADYTTCRDCPASWKIHGSTIHLTIQGYARISHMMLRIHDAPLFYLPYLVIPVKTKRQTGFLFPKYQRNTLNGFQFVQPFFLALGRSADATFGFGKYTARGWKAEAEFRYRLAERQFGQINLFGLQDRTFFSPYQNRWAAESNHQWELPGKVDARLYWLDTSDRDYARLFADDVPGRGEPALVSSLSVSKSSRWVSAWAETKRIKNMLRGPVTGFDHQTVQPLPELHLESTDQQLIPGVPLYGGLQTSWSRWWRQGPSADFLPGKTDPEGVFVPGRDPLRRGHRLVLSPELYYTANLGDVFELVPSLRWSSMFYDFDGPYGASTRRHFVRGRIELSTTVEKVYGGLIKHKMRPLVSYSNIPWVEEDKEHPFVQQLNYISASTSRLVSQNQGRQFDDHDIIPLYSDRVPQYFYPEGNSISYSLSNRFVLKSSDEVEEWQKPERKLFVNDRDPRPLPSLVAADQYRRVLDLWTGQTFDFTELRKDPRDQRPFSRLFHLMSLTTKRVQANSETYYYPYSQAFQFSIGGTFYIAKYAQRLLRFERSLRLSYSRNLVTSYNDALTLGVTWSLNDYLLLSAERSVDFLTARVLRTAGQIIYQSPSQCFQFILSLERSIDRGFSIRPSIAMNLGGGSFMGVSDSNAASSVAPTGATTLQ